MKGTLSEPEVKATVAIFGALDSHLRIQIIEHLAQRDHYVHELVRLLGKSQPLVSQHLRMLKQCGIVTSTRKGREVIYQLAMPEITELIRKVLSLAVRADQQTTSTHESASTAASVTDINSHRPTSQAEPERKVAASTAQLSSSSL